jgi:hypothetical protein
MLGPCLFEGKGHKHHTVSTTYGILEFDRSPLLKSFYIDRTKTFVPDRFIQPSLSSVNNQIARDGHLPPALSRRAIEQGRY